MSNLKLAFILIIGGLVLIALGFGLALILGEANSFLIACIIAGGIAEFIGVQLAMLYYARRK